MEIANYIQLGALLIALISLIWQQRRLANEQRRLANEEERKEKRIETKLIIFYVLSDREQDLNEDEIIGALEKVQPLSEVDKVEARKSLYEMLKDETVRFTKSKKYKTRRKSDSD